MPVHYNIHRVIESGSNGPVAGNIFLHGWLSSLLNGVASVATPNPGVLVGYGSGFLAVLISIDQSCNMLLYVPEVAFIKYSNLLYKIGNYFLNK